MESMTDKADDMILAEDPRPSSLPVDKLRNLGPKSAALLRAAGYEDLGALRRAGAVAVFRRLKATAPRRVSRVMLYALQGAIMDVHWNALPFAMKEVLLENLAAEEDRASSLRHQ